MSIVDVVDLGKKIRCTEVRFVVCPDLWGEVSISPGDLSEEIKYLDASGTGLNPAINDLPNDKGGIYLFYVKSDIIPCMTVYLMYIGRACKTKESQKNESSCNKSKYGHMGLLCRHTEFFRYR